MTSRLISSLVRCSIPRVSFISRSQFYSTTPLISRTLIPRNLISKPCCAISIKSASFVSLASFIDNIKRADRDCVRVLELVMAEKNKKNVLPKDFQFEIIDNPGSITLKREYGGEQIEAIVSMDYEHRIKISVTIDKRVGNALELCCNLTSNDFEIESMSLISSEDGDEDYYDLTYSDGRLQTALQEYLAERGLEKSLYDYLHYLMEQKGFAWQSLKEFLEK